jgi:hypothetical protein
MEDAMQFVAEMRRFDRAVIICVFFITTAFTSTPHSHLHAEMLPLKGTFEGTYRVDRWGVGRFAFYFVSPALRNRLQEFENVPIRLEVLRAVQQINPGPGIIEEIGDVSPIDTKNDPLSLEVTTSFPNWISPDQRAVTIFTRIHNGSAGPLRVSIKELIYEGSSPKSIANGHLPDRFMPGYTRSQSAIKRTIIQPSPWNQLVSGATAIESGHQFEIAGSDFFPIVQQILLPPGGHELIVTIRYRHGERRIKAEERVLVDVPPTSLVLSPSSSDAERSATTRLTASDISFQFPELTFRIDAEPADPPRRVVMCDRGSIPLLAGTIEGLDNEGSHVTLHIDERNSCSNAGEPWKLMEIPAEGLTTRIKLRVSIFDPPKKATLFRIKLLTDRGLGTLDIPRMPVGEVSGH